MFLGDMKRCYAVLLRKFHCSALASVRNAEDNFRRELFVPDRLKKRLEIAAVTGEENGDAGFVGRHLIFLCIKLFFQSCKSPLKVQA